MKTQPQPISHNADAPIDVMILAGGLGTRLRPVVSDRPKILAPIGGPAFLALLLQKIFSYRFGGRIILCTGYLSNFVEEYVAERAESDPRFRDVMFSREDQPLGTGGAVKRAAAFVRGQNFIAMNGDTFTSVNL